MLRRPKRDDLILSSLEPEDSKPGDEALGTEACLRISLIFGRGETCVCDTLLLWPECTGADGLLGKSR